MSILEYRIVWIDDRPDWVDSVIEEIEEHLKEFGYDPQVERFVDKEGLSRCTAADVDLVVIDYNLPEENGDSLISKIREQGSFKEIVFYSRDRPARDVIGSISGVWHCQRDEAVTTIRNVIDVTIRKIGDLGVVRGLVIAEAIDLEVKVEGLMVLLFGDNGDLFRARILEKGWIDFAKKHNFLNGVVGDKVKSLEGEAKSQLEAIKEILNRFVDEVVEQRNILAHSRRVVRDGLTVLEGINTKTRRINFDRAWLRGMRENLRKHGENLAALESFLSAELDSSGTV